MFVKLLVALLAAVSVNTTYGYMKVKPDYIPTCHKKDANFINCSTHAIQLLFNQIKDGVPEIDLPPTDPLFIKSINILQGDGPVSVNVSLRNITVVGFAKTEVLYNSVDPRDYDFFTKIHLPYLKIEGIYDLEGRILVLPMKGSGICWFEIKDLNIDLKSDVDLYQKHNYSFYNVTGAHVKFDIGGLRLYMGNLFDGMKSLERTTNEFLNENWKPAAESLRSVLEGTIEDIILSILKHIFDNVPADYFVADIAEPV